MVIKILQLQAMDKWKEYDLFLREARTLKNLNYKLIPQYVDFFKIEKNNDIIYCLVQEYVAGTTLEYKIKSGWRVTERIIYKITKTILNIVKYLQQFKPPVIHRDINPRNIIINDKNIIFLVDFGAVQSAALSSRVGTQTIVGTAGYMPMEQIMGRSCEATDLYAVGVTIIYLLSHTDPVDLPVKNMKIDFRAVIDVSKKFADFLDKLIAPDVNMRFKNAVAALDFLMAIDPKSKNSIIKEKLMIKMDDVKIEDPEWEHYINDFIRDVKKRDGDLYDVNFE
ncbi:MAG: protein kinase [Spirochaetia bacterium]